MIAEVIPAAYDGSGRKVSVSVFQRQLPGAALPLGRYISHPLTVQCESLRDVRRFLAGCQAGSTKDLFGKYCWQPPEEFERLKKGGCVDFSLWTWRQLLSLGYDARFVQGRSGRYGEGHAWIEYFKDGRCFLVEPQMGIVGDRFPRLTTLRYKPKLSVGWDGKALKYFVHQQSSFKPTWRLLAPLVWEWIVFWMWIWIKVAIRLPLLPQRMWRRRRAKAAATA